MCSTLEGVPGTTAVPAGAGTRVGPSPSTNMRKLLTPGVTVVVAVAGSAIPSAAGIVPPTLTKWSSSPPFGTIVSPEQMSKLLEPEQSAKLMIMEGVPAANAPGAANWPSVLRANPSSLATSERAIAAYITLHGPAARLTALPNVPETPPP